MDYAKAQSLLDITTPFTLEDAKKAWKALSKKHHPDLGGDATVMAEINAAFDLVEAVLTGKKSATGNPGPKASAQSKSQSQDKNAYSAPSVDISLTQVKRAQATAYRICERYIEDWLKAVKKANPLPARLWKKPTKVPFEPVHLHIADRLELVDGGLVMVFKTEPQAGLNIFFYPDILRWGGNKVIFDSVTTSYFKTIHKPNTSYNEARITTEHGYKIQVRFGRSLPVCLDVHSAPRLLLHTDALDTFEKALELQDA